MGELPRDLRAVIPRFLHDEGFVLASALSFAFLLCLAPLVLILFSVAGFLMESDAVAESLFDAATVLLPAYGQELAEFLTLLARERAVTGLLGGLGWAVFATQFFSLLRTVMNRAFRVSLRRSLVRGFAVDLVAVVVVGSLAIGFVVAIVILVTLGDIAARLVPVPLPSSASVRRAVSIPLIYAAGLGLLFFVYWSLPNTRVPARAPATATLAVVLAWEVARWAFTAYVHVFGTYGRLYGSYGIGVAALVWVYASAALFVMGAELAAIVAERIAGVSPGASA